MVIMHNILNMHKEFIAESLTAAEAIEKALDQMDLWLGQVVEAMEEAGEDYRILLLPDHPNLLRLRTHTPDPVPYVLFDSTHQEKKIAHYGETEAKATGKFEPGP